MEPAIEAIRVPQRRKVAPGDDERLLGCVLGTVRVTQDETGNGVESTDRDARQLRERVVIARHRPLDQLPVHRASMGRRGSRGRTHQRKGATAGRWFPFRFPCPATPAFSRATTSPRVIGSSCRRRARRRAVPLLCVLGIGTHGRTRLLAVRTLTTKSAGTWIVDVLPTPTDVTRPSRIQQSELVPLRHRPV